MLTPLDIESKVFTKAISGYSISEVKGFMKDVLAHYEKLYKENIELKDKVNVLNEGVKYYKNIEETLQNTLVLAEKMAEETKILARQKAEQVEKEAQLKAEVIINDAKYEVYKINKVKEELLHSYNSSRIQIKQFLKSQLELTEKFDADISSKPNPSVDEFLYKDSAAAEESDNSIEEEFEIAFKEEFSESTPENLSDTSEDDILEENDDLEIYEDDKDE